MHVLDEVSAWALLLALARRASQERSLAHDVGLRLGDDGEIVEDWSASDNLDVLRQLGVRRGLLLGLDWLRARRASRSAGRHVGEHPDS